MDQDSIHMVAASKVPMLKPENGNTAPKTTLVEGVEKVIPPTSAKEKARKELELKARTLISSTNGAVNTAHGATTVSTQAIVVNSTTIDNLRDVVICAFFESGRCFMQRKEGKEISLKNNGEGIFLLMGSKEPRKQEQGKPQENVTIGDNYFQCFDLMPKAVVNADRPKAVVNDVKGNNVNAVKASAYWGNPQMDLQDQGVIDSGCLGT
ncbi:hypothetical protein Tco_0375772 [Tanacetum coccineum]